MELADALRVFRKDDLNREACDCVRVALREPAQMLQTLRTRAGLSEDDAIEVALIHLRVEGQTGRLKHDLPSSALLYTLTQRALYAYIDEPTSSSRVASLWADRGPVSRLDEALVQDMVVALRAHLEPHYQAQAPGLAQALIDREEVHIMAHIEGPERTLEGLVDAAASFVILRALVMQSRRTDYRDRFSEDLDALLGLAAGTLNMETLIEQHARLRQIPSPEPPGTQRRLRSALHKRHSRARATLQDPVQEMIERVHHGTPPDVLVRRQLIAMNKELRAARRFLQQRQELSRAHQRVLQAIGVGPPELRSAAHDQAVLLRLSATLTPRLLVLDAVCQAWLRQRRRSEG